MLAAILICGTTMVLSSCSSKDNSSSTEPKNAGAPDYSQKSCWHQIPEITKEFDTFFIYPTEYIGSNESTLEQIPLRGKLTNLLGSNIILEHHYRATLEIA